MDRRFRWPDHVRCVTRCGIGLSCPPRPGPRARRTERRSPAPPCVFAALALSWIDASPYTRRALSTGSPHTVHYLYDRVFAVQSATRGILTPTPLQPAFNDSIQIMMMRAPMLPLHNSIMPKHIFALHVVDNSFKSPFYKFMEVLISRFSLTDSLTGDRNLP